MDAGVTQLLKKNEFLELVESGEGDAKRTRVKCQLTQHEMLPRVDVIESHLKSKKFVKARDWYCHDYSQYEPYIVPHRRLPKSLYCNVTGTILNRIPSEVEKHVSGKRYKRMKQHVKIKVKRSEDDEDDEAQGKGEFDADAFEFENSQVVYSDAESEDDDGGEAELQDEHMNKSKKKKQEEEEDDMADLYPDDESDEEMENGKDENGDETMEDKPQKKRAAKGNDVPKKRRHQTKKAKKTE
ncbi:Surfeit locus protein 2 [Phytophthora boehmeriae]|uniref:Surfeit locus protein 2 n=1 Tax=Phytophthora boehmeriae TaxID=109152 RepID=A0A8T1WPW2_9STRA|nr:Surfeit locus protein 2 [Phytophthora boehmeriae]